MAPPLAAENIKKLLFSTNQHCISDHNTLLAAYQELDCHLEAKNVTQPMVIIADGHASRFDLSVLNFLRDKQLILYIVPPDTTGVTKYLDQVNQKIHSAYCSTKDELFKPFNTINREVFRKMLGNAWQKWITPEGLVNAAKHGGISATGLNVNWMDEEKFQAARNLLECNRTPQKKNEPNSLACLLESPVGVRKGKASY